MSAAATCTSDCNRRQHSPASRVTILSMSGMMVMMMMRLWADLRKHSLCVRAVILRFAPGKRESADLARNNGAPLSHRHSAIESQLQVQSPTHNGRRSVVEMNCRELAARVCGVMFHHEDVELRKPI